MQKNNENVTKMLKHEGNLISQHSQFHKIKKLSENSSSVVQKKYDIKKVGISANFR